MSLVPAAVPRIDTGNTIAAPAAVVWAILTDFPRYGEWNRYIGRVDGPAVAGAELLVTTRDERSGHQATRPVRVVALAPYLMRWVGEAGISGTFRGDHVFALAPSAAGVTTLRHCEDFTGTAAAAILDAYGAALRAGFETFNRCLKEAAERRASDLARA